MPTHNILSSCSRKRKAAMPPPTLNLVKVTMMPIGIGMRQVLIMLRHNTKWDFVVLTVLALTSTKDWLKKAEANGSEKAAATLKEIDK